MAYDKEVIIPIFEMYKMYDVVRVETTYPRMVYNSLFKYHKILELSEQQKQIIWKTCEGKHEQEKERIQNCKTDSLADYKRRKAFLALIDKPDGRKEQITELVHLHCIKMAFDVMIENGFEFKYKI